MRDRKRRRNSAILVAVTLSAVCLSSCAREPKEPDPEPQGLWSTLKEKAGSVVTDSLVKNAIDQTESLLGTLNRDYAPVILEAGFEISEVRVSIGVPPGLALRVRRIEIVGAEKQEELLDRHRDNEMLAGILSALFALNRFEAEGYELKEILIHSDLPPRVTMILVPLSAA